jgi:hypothetical protein
MENKKSTQTGSGTASPPLVHAQPEERHTFVTLYKFYHDRQESLKSECVLLTTPPGKIGLQSLIVNGRSWSDPPPGSSQ